MPQLSSTRFLNRNSPPHIATLLLMTILSAMSMNILLPSLPEMARYFDTDYSVMQLSVALYLAVNGVLQIAIGPLSDRFGRRPVILWGFAIFVLATLGSLYAPNIELFLFFRMSQGAIVVAMALGRAIVRDVLPADQAASQIAYITMGTALAPMLSPTLGGVLSENFGWQANFWLMLGLGVAFMALVWADLGETAPKSDRSILAQFGQYPELLTSVRFWGYAGTSALASGAFFAYLGGAPFVGSELFGLSPSELGLYFGAPGLGYFFGNFFAGRYSVRVGLNRMIVIGTLIVTLCMLLTLVIFETGNGSAFRFFAMMTGLGFGNGLLLPNATSGMLSVRPHMAGTASGLGGALMIGGGAALSAWAGSMLNMETGATPLLWLMFSVAALSVLCITIVIRREKSLPEEIRL
jgi:MFS transporter, DHA1 family, multidrug resistance protein